MEYSFRSKEELLNFIAAEVITTTEALEILGCSRQYIGQLVKDEKLIPIKRMHNASLFLRSDVAMFKRK
ncbi:DNA-binding protein [Alkalicella caledoniensis]|uniref:DNA-binding protein n=1 Tax=Alkalicella caledoniensis TaxID=2731377 RepID=A0A7G9W897_ALKCA|nr:DNA-binding protein [Alkalicella caledoniensis]QNO14909.1 DNA-binding protein [Alkalicella caledoniensis]